MYDTTVQSIFHFPEGDAGPGGEEFILFFAEEGQILLLRERNGVCKDWHSIPALVHACDLSNTCAYLYLVDSLPEEEALSALRVFIDYMEHIMDVFYRGYADVEIVFNYAASDEGQLTHISEVLNSHKASANADCDPPDFNVTEAIRQELPRLRRLHFRAN